MLGAVVTIRSSTLEELQAHGEALFREHWDEVALNKRVMRLDPDWDTYRRLEASGVMLCLAAFEGLEANTLVGYAVTFVHQHLHYRGLTYAQNDVLFVTARHRKGSVGLSLIEETAKAARARGARLLVWHAKEGTKLDALLPRLGYGVQDVIYSKEI